LCLVVSALYLHSSVDFRPFKYQKHNELYTCFKKYQIGSSYRLLNNFPCVVSVACTVSRIGGTTLLAKITLPFFYLNRVRKGYAVSVQSE
jgi:hypothetical protein